MGLKQLINRQKIQKLQKAVSLELEMPGEPLIYSIKNPVGNRSHPLQHFRNIQWCSLLKCFFRSYYKTNTPVVVIARFYVSPPEKVRISAEELKKQRTPAIFAYELCDYTLSLLEMLHHVLINSYKQIVKLDVDKFYSANPRTILKFMRYDEYVQLQNNNPIYTKTKSICKARKKGSIQPEQPGNGADAQLRDTEPADRLSAHDRPVASNSALHDPCAFNR